jgi:drug/metabolite transporter (DMT)-like permease
MSLAVCVPAALASAAAYGTASAVQHRAAHTGKRTVDARGIGRLLTDPFWLAGAGADVAGLALQVLALATGPVTIVQPLQVLTLLVAFPVGAALGGPVANRRRIGAATLIAVAVAGFLLLAGDPGNGRAPRGVAVLVLSVSSLAVGAVIAWTARHRGPSACAVSYGAVSGAWFAVAAVALRVTSLRVAHGGFRVLVHPLGLVPLLCMLVVGGAALATMQAAFQVGTLANSLPAATATDPVVAVVLGVSLLGERLPLGAVDLLGYLAALAVVAIGARELTRPDPVAAGGTGSPGSPGSPGSRGAPQGPQGDGG